MSKNDLDQFNLILAAELKENGDSIAVVAIASHWKELSSMTALR